MFRRLGFFCSLAGAAVLTGCAGVPRLYKPAIDHPETALAPKVEHIVGRVTCELADISRTQLAGREYVITVLLTLQVNDEINLTPSLSFIDVLASAGTSRTLTENLGLGGGRERSFTSTFYFNSVQLASQPGCDGAEKRLYRLDGNLGLAEIARDGMGITRLQMAGGGAESPSPPSFSSQVKFVVTRSVGALGPTWTLVSFKGPGGANGLINGKALTTDSVNVAFAVKKPDASASARAAAKRLTLALEELTGQERRLASLIDARRAAVAEAERVRQLIASRFSSRPIDKTRSEAALSEARSALATVERQRGEKSVELARMAAELEAALATTREAQGRADDDAIRTGRELITTTILQNLTTFPR